jgi:hypothetical protein
MTPYQNKMEIITSMCNYWVLWGHQKKLHFDGLLVVLVAYTQQQLKINCPLLPV